MGWFKEGPKKGDHVWWRGMRMVVTEVDDRLVHYRNAIYRCASALKEFRYNAVLELWYLPGTTGEMPKVVRGELVDPDPPTCEKCGAVTFRVRACTTCRLKKEA